jgi:hypothetical protein
MLGPIGLAAIGKPMTGGELLFNIVATLLGILVMIHLAVRAANDPGLGPA